MVVFLMDNSKLACGTSFWLSTSENVERFKAVNDDKLWYIRDVNAY